MRGKSEYELSVEELTGSGEETPRSRHRGEHEGADELLAALREEILSALRETCGEDQVAVEARIETVCTHLTYKQLFERLAPLAGEEVRLGFADGRRRRGRLGVRVGTGARELLLDDEELAWRGLASVERLLAPGRFAAWCEGPAAPAWTISGLVVARRVSGPPSPEATVAGPLAAEGSA